MILQTHVSHVWYTVLLFWLKNKQIFRMFSLRNLRNRALFTWSRRTTCAKDPTLFYLNYPQINEVGTSDHVVELLFALNLNQLIFVWSWMMWPSFCGLGTLRERSIRSIWFLLQGWPSAIWRDRFHSVLCEKFSKSRLFLDAFYSNLKKIYTDFFEN